MVHSSISLFIIILADVWYCRGRQVQWSAEFLKLYSLQVAMYGRKAKQQKKTNFKPSEDTKWNCSFHSKAHMPEIGSQTCNIWLFNQLLSLVPKVLKLFMEACWGKDLVLPAFCRVEFTQCVNWIHLLCTQFHSCSACKEQKLFRMFLLQKVDCGMLDELLDEVLILIPVWLL